MQRQFKDVAYLGNRIDIHVVEVLPGVFRLDGIEGSISPLAPVPAPPPFGFAKPSTSELSLVVGEGYTVLEPVHDIVIIEVNGEAYYAFSYVVRDADGHSPIAFFDAHTSKLLRLERPISEKTGTIVLQTNLPYDDFETIGKQAHSIPLVDICDARHEVGGVYVCNTSTLLTTTDYHGAFSISDDSGNVWFIDFRGDWLNDVGDDPLYNQCDPAITDLTAQIWYPDDLDVSWQSNNCSGRRGELFYHANYARKFASDMGWWNGTYQPVNFYVRTTTDNISWCQGGETEGAGTRIRVNCGAQAGNPTSNSGEAQTRETIKHEYSHSISHSLRGSWAYDCVEPWCYPEVIEEAWADYSSITMNQFEFYKRWKDYLEDYDFPDDYVPGNRTDGVFVMLNEFHHQVGPHAYVTILNLMDEHNNDIILVGTDDNDCSTDVWPVDSPDGFVTVDDCERNSFYRHLLYEDRSKFSYSNEHVTEISRALHRHVSDGNPESGADEPFPWKDTVTNLSHNGPMLPLEYSDGERELVLVYGPDYPDLPVWNGGENQLGFEYTTDGGNEGDIDKFTIFARAGEHYQLETTVSDTDSKIEIRDAWWTSAVSMCPYEYQSICIDDDGGQGLASKLDFFPTQTGWYRVYVYPYSVWDAGPEAKYTLAYRIVDDDYGDAFDEAHPAGMDWSVDDGTMDYSTDVDMLYVYAAQAGTLYYHICSDDGLTPNIELYNADGYYLSGSYFSNSSCASAYTTYSLPSGGIYYVRIGRTLGSTPADYKFKLYMSVRDLDSDTPATAFDVSTLSGLPYSAVATGFESAGDEDWFKFDAEAGDVWAVEIFSTESGVDTEIQVWPPTEPPDTLWNNEYFMRDDNGGVDGDDASAVVFTAPRTGEYHVRVSEVDQNAGDYSIVFRYNGAWSSLGPDWP